ncbi:MAG: YdiU family protein [Actinomycetota bacterium]
MTTSVAAPQTNPLGLHFTNRFTRDLPADPIADNTRRQVHGACFSRVMPTETAAPELIAHSSEVAELLGLSEAEVASPEFTSIFNGNLVTPDMDPYAMCYGGHQFGNWAGQLGDGRAIALGEVEATDGSHQTLQLKGSGPTPYSRTADGRAVLRSSIREFLCSEAMFHLGVPTTRALSLTWTGDEVMRDMFYDGNAANEPGAVVCRVAPSFLRFGNFQLFPSRGDTDNLRTLVEWTIRNDFPHLDAPADGSVPLETITEWFAEICRTTADLIVHWMRVGFVHGVMNTDNLSILGLTIDYGPYGWLEGFDPNWTPNTTDAQGRRYRFGNQPSVAHWNLVQLANAIATLYAPDTSDDLDQAAAEELFKQQVEPLQAAIDQYAERFTDGWNTMSAERLGFDAFDGEADVELFGELGRVLSLTETDMTIFHRRLADVDVAAVVSDPSLTDDEVVAAIADAWYGEPRGNTVGEVADWIRAWAARVAQDGSADGPAADARIARMKAINPKYVLRNWMAQLAIDRSENGDHEGVTELLEVLRRPYDEQPDCEDRFFVKRPEWARERAGCSMLSCSS